MWTQVKEYIFAFGDAVWIAFTAVQDLWTAYWNHFWTNITRNAGGSLVILGLMCGVALMLMLAAYADHKARRAKPMLRFRASDKSKKILADIIYNGLEVCKEKKELSHREARRLRLNAAAVLGIKDQLQQGRPKLHKYKICLLKEAIKARLGDNKPVPLDGPKTGLQAILAKHLKRVA